MMITGIRKHLKGFITSLASALSIAGLVILAFLGEDTGYELIRVLTIILVTVLGATAVILLSIIIFQKVIKNLAQMLAKMLNDPNVTGYTVVDYKLHNAVLLKEGYPHISMRRETIQTIFDSVLSDTATTGNSDRLKELGKSVANNFINTTWNTMNTYVSGISDSPSDKLAKWAEMERTAGWGLLKTEFNAIGNTGSIRIENCFLAIGRQTTQESLCPFLVGYFEVIVTNLIGVSVMFSEVGCGKGNSTEPVCNFTFSPTPSTQSSL